MKSKYKEFSYVYEIMNYDFPYDLWLDIIRPYNKGTSVLDIGSGTGEVLKRIDASNKVGIDNSETMIEIAKNNDASSNYILRDMVDFKFEETFDLIIATTDVLNYVPNIETLEIVLMNIKAHMSKDSVFIFDMHSEFKILNDFNGEMFMDESDNTTYIWEAYRGDSPLSVIHELTFFIKEKDNLYNKYKETHYQQGFQYDSIIKLLKKLEFTVINAFSDFDPSNDIVEVSERNFFIIKLK